MKPLRILILYYFLRFRLSRLMYRGRVASGFRATWQKTLRASPFYRTLLDEGKAFPLMNKALFMEHFDAINTVGITREEALEVALKSEQTRDFTPTIGEISVGLSSGTSGNKGLFLTSAVEQAIWVGAILDRVLGWSFRKRRVAFFLRANNNLYESVSSGLIRFLFFDILRPMDQLVDELVEANVHILVAQPSVLFEIAQRLDSQGRQRHFTKVISVAEVLEGDQKAFFQQVFRCRVDQVYQCTEGFLAYTCKEGNLHFNEDWLTIEKKYLDENRVRFHPVITDHLRRSQPVVRYELNDIIHEGAPCHCGSRMMTIEKIEGRSDDAFRFKTPAGEQVIFPDFIRRAVIRSTDHILNYQVTRVDYLRLTVALQVKDVTSMESVFCDVKDALGTLFVSLGIDGMEIAYSEWSHDPAKKFKRIANACPSI